MVMGDLNAKVGTEQDPQKVVGQHGLGERNERGDLWVDWCTTHEQVIMNTWLQHEKRHLYTWKCPGDTTRNQIYHITINQRFCNSMLHVKGDPGADCASDHVTVIATMRVKLRNMNITKTVKKLQFDLLRTDDEYTAQFQRHISEHMEGINTIDNVDDRYIKFRNALTESAQQVLPDVDRTSKQKWMTAPILHKMNQRRLDKGDDDLYNLLHKEIKQACIETKEARLNEQCQLIDQLDAAHKTNLMHCQIKEVTGKTRGNGTTTCIEAKDGTIIMEKDKILDRWSEYIGEL